MPQVAIEIGLILFLIVLNGVFSLSEIALVSSRKARLQQRAAEGDGGAARALALADSPDRFLSTVQIGITLVGILTGAFSGKGVAEALTHRFTALPALAPYAGTLALIAVVLATTYLSLVLGELVPKRVGLNNPERIAAVVAGPMSGLSRIAAPFVWLLSASTTLVTRLLGMKPSDEPPITEEEVRVLIRQGTQAGVFEAAEQDMVDRVFRLMDRRVGAIAVPRPDMVWLDADSPPEVLQARLQTERHSHYPVCERDPDHILGIAHSRDLLAALLSGEPLDMRSLIEPALFVPESTRAVSLLEQFKTTRKHMAIVVDEHGGTHGLITLTAILEALVGEIPQPGEEFEPQVLQRDDGSWLVDGLLPIDELKALTGLRKLPEEEEAGYTTVGGLMAAQLGRIPHAGDRFAWDGLTFEIVDMDGKRVDKVLIQPEASD